MFIGGCGYLYEKYLTLTGQGSIFMRAGSEWVLGCDNIRSQIRAAMSPVFDLKIGAICGLFLSHTVPWLDAMGLLDFITKNMRRNENRISVFFAV